MKPLIVGLAVAALYLGALSTVSVYNVDHTTSSHIGGTREAGKPAATVIEPAGASGLEGWASSPRIGEKGGAVGPWAGRAATRSLVRLALASPAAQVTLADPAARAQTSPSALASAASTTRSGAEGSAAGTQGPDVRAGEGAASGPSAQPPNFHPSNEGLGADYLHLRRAISWCESRDEPTAVNKASGAAGLFQFIPETWREVTGLEPPASAYSAAVQTAAFDKLFATQGTAPWYSSRSCWSALIEGSPRVTMRIGVTGGRDYDGWHAVAHALAQLPADAILVHGAARGADQMCAEWWGDIQGRVCEAHPADWAKHGKAAGPLRNQEMVDSGLDLLIAFPGGRGTADMVTRASEAGVRVLLLAGSASRALIEGAK